MRVGPVILLMGAMLAGCASDTPSPEDVGEGTAMLPETDAAGRIDHAAVAANIGRPILDVEDLHDHNDAHQHTASHNIEFVGWSDMGVTLGDNGFANFVLWSDGVPIEEGGERLALIAVDGDNEGGFAIADVRDPADIQVLGRGWKAGNNIQEVRISPDGRFAFTNIQTISDPANSLGANCPVCLTVWNIEDRSAPQMVSYTPVELAGTHNLHLEEHGGALYVHYVGQPLAGTPVDPGNHVWIGRVVESPAVPGVPATAHVVSVSQYEHDRSNDQGRTFPHDVMVQDHPVTGQKIAYVSHWDGGHVAFDVTDPMLPQEIGVLAEAAPSDALAIHWIWQEEWVRPARAAAGGDGAGAAGNAGAANAAAARPVRVIAWSAPEIGSLDSGSGIIRAIDVTDPADMHQVGWWELPGNVTILDRYIMSPHTVFVDPETGLAAVSHYHAGVWVLDVSDETHPRHLGFYLPHGDPAEPYDGPLWWKKPNFSPDGYGPNVYQARWDDRGDETILWVSDRGTGLYALRYTGPVPGPLA